LLHRNGSTLRGGRGAARLADTAREAGVTDPEQLGEQLALLLDGASARSRVLNTDTLATAAAIDTILVNNALGSRGMLSS
jgi:hypothetical protein